MLLEDINHIALIGSLMQQMCVYLAIAYLLSKTPLFAPLMQVTVRLPDKLVCYFVFSSFCIMGTDLVSRLTADRPDLPVIFSSGYSQESDDARLALEDGANFLQKPYRPATLVRLIRERLTASGGAAS